MQKGQFKVKNSLFFGGVVFSGPSPVFVLVYLLSSFSLEYQNNLQSGLEMYQMFQIPVPICLLICLTLLHYEEPKILYFLQQNMPNFSDVPVFKI